MKQCPHEQAGDHIPSRPTLCRMGYSVAVYMGKLYGECILDPSSMADLREEIREEVLSEIKEKGLRIDEMISFLMMYDYKTYMRVISETIDHAVEDAEKSKKTWDGERRAAKMLNAIQAVIMIS